MSFRAVLLGSIFTLGCLTWIDPAAAQEKPNVKVGILGLDNYQAVAYAHLFNDPKATGDLAGLKVTLAVPTKGSPDVEDSLTALEKWKAQIVKHGVELTDSVDEMLKQVDCVMIMSVDARQHVEQAERVLRAKKRLYVGRPLAANFADLVKIYRVAKETGTPFFSCSQHRFSPGFYGMRDHAEVGKVLGCDVYGGCPTEPHHAEFYWHAVHGIDTLQTIMGPGCVSLTCTSTPSAEVITGVWNDGRVGTFRGIKEGKLKYSATVFGDKGVSTAGIYGHGVPVQGVVPTKDKYMGYEGVAIEMAKFFKGAEPPVTPAETLEVFAFMEAAHDSKEQSGATVKLDKYLSQVK